MSSSFFQWICLMTSVFFVVNIHGTKEYETYFHIFSKAHIERPVTVSWTDRKKWGEETSFRSCAIKLIAHGYAERWNMDWRWDWVAELKNEILSNRTKENYCVIAVDWEKGAREANFITAVANADIAGYHLADFVQNNQLDPKRLHCIGFRWVGERKGEREGICSLVSVLICVASPRTISSKCPRRRSRNSRVSPVSIHLGLFCAKRRLTSDSPWTMQSSSIVFTRQQRSVSRRKVDTWTSFPTEAKAVPVAAKSSSRSKTKRTPIASGSSSPRRRRRTMTTRTSRRRTSSRDWGIESVSSIPWRKSFSIFTPTSVVIISVRLATSSPRSITVPSERNSAPPGRTTSASLVEILSTTIEPMHGWDSTLIRAIGSISEVTAVSIWRPARLRPTVLPARAEGRRRRNDSRRSRNGRRKLSKPSVKRREIKQDTHFWPLILYFSGI